MLYIVVIEIGLVCYVKLPWMKIHRGDKAGQPAPHLVRKNAGRVGPPRKVIAG